MEVTPSGLTGGILHVAKNAEEDFGNALVNATILLQQTVEETAADWDQLKKHGVATYINVQVNVSLIKKYAYRLGKSE